ncbi:hypothetical protein NDU88_005664 [Pleurodeles waltl]|uniref:Uncharacterized protein n=1 Tax=Pleurodeles waltl TaxID=8319 RepID=A0AAV7WA72_PLEWA|nr:hypothetical protein NDU88_005664 [Pleurodeles waltl]
MTRRKKTGLLRKQHRAASKLKLLRQQRRRAGDALKPLSRAGMPRLSSASRKNILRKSLMTTEDPLFVGRGT